MTLPDRTGVHWRRPSHCESSSCVEVLQHDEKMFVRGPGGNVVGFTLAEWREFIVAAKVGEYDV